MDWMNAFGKAAKFPLTRTVLHHMGVGGLVMGSILLLQMGFGGNALALSAHGMDQPVAAPSGQQNINQWVPTLLPNSFFQKNVLSQSYSYPVNAVNPTVETNPNGASFPGGRGENQLIIYTPAFGEKTKTTLGNGKEAVVVDNVVTKITLGDTSIPPTGFVVSGHGRGANWIGNILKPGTHLTFTPDQKSILAQWTPQVYLGSLSQGLTILKKKVEAHRQEDPQFIFPGALSLGEKCIQSLEENYALVSLANTPEAPLFLEQANDCQKILSRGFYETFQMKPDEFRGVWVRPNETNPQAIETLILQYKALGIQNIFLETYYQGKTVYPSKVMEAYGLPPQHSQFKGSDPLKAWMEIAHRHGLKVHVWFQTFLAGNQRDSAEVYGPILAKYPQWRNIQKAAITASVPVPSNIEEGHYFLDPANLEVRQFLEKLVMELVTQYPVDGVNLDYIRYPASLPIEKPGYLESNWGYTPVALKAFQQTVETELWVQQKLKQEKLKPEKLKQDTPRKAKADSSRSLEQAKGLKNTQLERNKLKGSQKLSSGEGKQQDKLNDEKALSPLNPLVLKPGDPLWPRWVNWRKQQVSLWVQEVSGKIKASRPQALISAVVFPRPDAQYALKLQDWPLWVENKWVQALTPIGLPSSAEQMYQKSLVIQQITHHKVPVYVGIFGLYNRQSPVEMVSQIEAVHRAGLDGVVLFDGGRLTPDYWQALSEGPFRVPVK
jgi:uncharacterized lipoprotein YddW (UPF0748 family)